MRDTVRGKSSLMLDSHHRSLSGESYPQKWQRSQSYLRDVSADQQGKHCQSELRILNLNPNGEERGAQCWLQGPNMLREVEEAAALAVTQQRMQPEVAREVAQSFARRLASYTYLTPPPVLAAASGIPAGSQAGEGVPNGGHQRN